MGEIENTDAYNSNFGLSAKRTYAVREMRQNVGTDAFVVIN